MVLTLSRIDYRGLIRMIVAGAAWGLTLSTGFFIVALWQCGLPCPDDISVVTAACIGTGILTIGPLAASLRPAEPQKDERCARYCLRACLSFPPSLSQSVRISQPNNVPPCKGDYDKYCKGAVPGGGRVLACLNRQYAQLTEACKKVVDLQKK